MKQISEELKEKRREKAAAYYAANREKWKGYGRTYRAANREKRRIQRAAYYAANREKEKAYQANYRASSPEKVRGMGARYRASNPDKVKGARVSYYAANRERLQAKARAYASTNREGRKAYRAANSDKFTAYTSQRRAAKLLRFPKWAQTPEVRAEMEEFYELARKWTAEKGEPYAVDHIYPLQGRTVSGLHVPDNLAVLPARMNTAKLNRHPEEFFGRSFD